MVTLGTPVHRICENMPTIIHKVYQLKVLNILSITAFEYSISDYFELVSRVNKSNYEQDRLFRYNYTSFIGYMGFRRAFVATTFKLRVFSYTVEKRS